MKESYQRMDIWVSSSTDSRHRRLTAIGETRWWSKEAALSKVFGHFNKPDGCLFVDTIITLEEVMNCLKLNSDARAKANGFLDFLKRYDTVLTAQVFLRIFSVITPVSKYLQDKNNDISKAASMIINAQKSLNLFCRDFDTVELAANRFYTYASAELERRDSRVELEQQLPVKRQRRVKVMDGEMANDESINDEMKKYEVEVHNRIMDIIINSINERFTKNIAVYRQFACFDPRSFNELLDNGIDVKMFSFLSEKLLCFNDEATPENIRTQLLSFASNWKSLKCTIEEDFVESVADGDELEEYVEEEEDFGVSEKRKLCKNCLACVYNVLYRYSLLASGYDILGLCYKFLLTLSVVQVTCERCFSLLKCIKTRIRSTMSQENLESFILMASEKDILHNISYDSIIDGVAEKSDLLSKLLFI